MGSPASAAATRSRTCWMSSLPAWPTSAQPPATASRHPVLPHRQARPSAAVEREWPISPAAPTWPLTSRPSEMMPSPRPVEAFTTRASRSTAPRASSSDWASTSASFAITRGASVSDAKNGPSSTPSQPGMTGESTHSAADLVDGAGEAEADREQRGLPARELAGGALHDPRHQLGGSGAGGVVDGVGGQLLAAQVEDADLAAGPADRDRQHHAGVRVDGEGGRGTAAGGGQLLAGQQQAAGDQGGDPGGDRGAGEAGQPAEVGAGGRPAAADEVEDHAGGRSGGCAEVAVGLHAVCSSSRRTSVAGYVHLTLI